MTDALKEKFRQGRPMEISPADAELIREVLRRVMAVTLETEREQISDNALVFDELGLDSIDVFDMLEQLADEFEVQIELEHLPQDLIYGRDGLTFGDFAEAFIAYFGSAPVEQEQ
ncbi:MAG: acyl carrier protein [SAR324 cluster bacterium]|nr:acyl carrier protein [SAR324 cluster bacterium]MCZ6556520.1 acyl carrier protein [SAR324 cluster bacterium]